MELHYPTLALVLWTASLVAGAVMAMVWRINHHERGPALWAASSLVVAFSFVPLWFETDLISGLILVNNVASTVAVLLLLEGILRFKGVGNEYRRLPWYGVYVVTLASLLYLTLSLDNHQLRYLFLDANLSGLLLLTAFFLVRGVDDRLERLIYGGTAAVFLLLAAAVFYRWTQAATGVIGPDDRVNPASGWIIFASIPWILGWTYGLAMAANLRAQRTIEDMAQHDPLTGLPNRRLLADAMERMAERSSPGSGAPGQGFGVVALDVNGFKEINDHYGHAFGDAALVKLAELLLRGLRPEDKVIRLGGDEFVLLLHGVTDRADLEQLCGRVLKVLEMPVSVKGHVVRFSVSLGTSLCPDDSTNAERLLALADQRMYANKTGKTSESAVWCAAPADC
ncbi:GGDEF domain-containing protein [Halorhodospira halophila]|uniref:GGDEF domain-containing protein n=1 Tax=Halorhodospira halophila TaxID=1053 RepID=UPI00191438AE|nr:GGDEF domain-containing protein [Halorhodospira halophila]